MTAANDLVFRALTADNAFRVITVRATDTVRGVVGAQNARGSDVEYLGELVAGTVLVRETMAPTLRVQGLLRGAGGKGRLVVDSNPDGGTRGLLSRDEDEPFALGPGAMLHVMRTLPNSALHQGVVEAPTCEGVSGALMAYMQLSEQVVSVVGVGIVRAGNEVATAGGYIVQLLPEADRDAIRGMTARLKELGPLDAVLKQTGADPYALLDVLLGGAAYAPLEARPLAFDCPCSDVRLLGTLATLPRTDIEELVRDGQVLEMGCDFCGKQYRINPAQLRGLIDPS